MNDSMTIFKTAILPYQHIFKDLKNNISLRELSFLALYILFLLYNWQIIDRVVAYGNKDTLLILRIIVFVQELLILPVFAFCLKKVYLTTIYSESFNSKISLTPNIEQSSNRTFRLFSISIIGVQVLLSSLSVLTNYSFVWLIPVFVLFPGYFVIFPAFVFIERPQLSFIESILVLNKVLYNKKTKIILVTAIAAAIFLFVQTIVRHFLVGFLAYEVVNSNGQNVTTGLLISSLGLYDFISCYIGMIIYVKFSLILYLKFKQPKY